MNYSKFKVNYYFNYCECIKKSHDSLQKIDTFMLYEDGILYRQFNYMHA